MKVQLSIGNVFNGYRAGGLIVASPGTSQRSLLSQLKTYGGDKFRNGLHEVIATPPGVTSGDVVAIPVEGIQYGVALVAFLDKGDEQQLEVVFKKIFDLATTLGIANLVLPLIGTGSKGIDQMSWAESFNAALGNLTEVQQLLIDSIEVVIDPISMNRNDAQTITNVLNSAISPQFTGDF